MTAPTRTPAGERLHIAIFGRRNAGKSTLLNAIAGQQIAIVSDVPGTTTDPVSKAMELLPLGPVLLTDTAGLDDEGKIGELRVERSLRVLGRTDLALLVVAAGEELGAGEENLIRICKENDTTLLLVINKIDQGRDYSSQIEWGTSRELPFCAVSAESKEKIDELKQKIIQIAPKQFTEPTIIGDVLSDGDLAILVVPIDFAAPKGRLILPQVLTLRDLLDHDAQALVVKETGLRRALDRLGQPPKIVITDSQAFKQVSTELSPTTALTSFSILMARYKGDLTEFIKGLTTLAHLSPDDQVLIAEGCTHHRQKGDIGTIKLPMWLEQHLGFKLRFEFCSGLEFPADLKRFKVIIHCGGCMLNRREVLYRQAQAQGAGVPMTNYGLTLAYVHGLMPRALEPFTAAHQLWKELFKN